MIIKRTEIFTKWFKKLNMNIQVELLRHINKLSDKKFQSCQPVGGGVHELRIHFQKGYRIYFTNTTGEIILLLHGGDKASQQRDIVKAKEIKKDLARQGGLMKKAKIKTEDFFEGFANDIKGNPKKLKEFEKAVNKIYAQTGDIDVILGALKVLACLKGNISKLAKDSKVERASVYNILKKGSNPTFRNVVSVSHNLGVHFSMSFA